jgi:D-glycero-beta-D-manno-heptose-7-phosphate kinase
MENFQELFSKFRDIRIGVVGDVMLDTYMWGHVDRISPEAPVPVVLIDKKEQRIGGAGNVALNLQSLGAHAFVLTVRGDDEDGRELEALFTSKKINTGYSISSKERITTNKTRIISRNQQMMRLDAEMTTDLTDAEEKKLLSAVQSFIKNERPHLIILEDYNKGVLTEEIIQEVIGVCKEAGVLVAVDPKRKNFFAYKGVDIFKPNLKEVKDGLNLLINDVNDDVLADIHTQLNKQLSHKISFITLSEKGVYYNDGNKATVIPSHVRAVSDVSGAGDTVIAVAALVYATTGNVQLMAEMANIAGGLVCEEVGTVAINSDRLQRECELLLS